MTNDLQTQISEVCECIVDYLMRSQDFSSGDYYGSFWSEKGYHGPLLDYHAGGSHHNRGAASAGLALWTVGKLRDDQDMMRRAELAFDWLAARQLPNGGYHEIQNNEIPADWEQTGLEECSTIALGFVAHGLGNALLQGLPGKKLYSDCLSRAGHWQLSIEWPPGSGIFPHHSRSPHDTLNGNTHAAEALAMAQLGVEKLTGRRLQIFYQGAKRAIRHTLTLQWPNGCMPYRDYGHITINYTSLVLWGILNVMDALPDARRSDIAEPDALDQAKTKAGEFLRSCIANDGALLWEDNETSTAKYKTWTYILTYNVLMRIAGEENVQAASRLLGYALAMRTDSGLLPMRDRGEEITECLYQQADVLLFLLPFSGWA